MFACGLAVSFILLMMYGAMPGGAMSGVVDEGYYMGGTVYWEARNPANPREITIDFGFKFDSQKESITHHKCTQEKFEEQEELLTGGFFRVNGRIVYPGAHYYCSYLDSNKHIASGYQRITYTLPSTTAVVPISYRQCCWISSVSNNAEDITSGLGWNLASTINTDHGDGTINSPPKSKTFSKYLLQSGCPCSIHIPSEDANNDKVKCRWTKGSGECNKDAMDICGTPYFDTEKSKPVAAIDEESCTLTFGEPEAIRPGTYAMMVMLEDFSDSRPQQAISKTPVHFLMEVFRGDGECRQPSLNVPDGICFAHVLGEEFTMRMVATASAPQYTITSIDVEGFKTDTPRRVPDTEADYFIIFRFTPTEAKMYSFCAMAREDERFGCTQACFTVDVVEAEQEPAALRVDKVNSIPAAGSQEAQAGIVNWVIKFNRRIRKGVFGPAYVTVRNSSNNAVVWQVDATGPGADVNWENLTFPSSNDFYLNDDTEYKISLGEGAVQSNDDSCSVKSKPSEWSFVTQPPAKSQEHEIVCRISSGMIYIAKLKVAEELDGHGPEIMHLRDPSCIGSEFNDTYYSILTSYGQCGTLFQRNSTHITYSNTVYIPQKPYRPLGTNVTRVPQSEIRVSCTLPAATINTLQYNPSPGTNVVHIMNSRPEFLDDLTPTSLKLFKNARYTQAYGESAHPLDVTFDTRLYFQGKAPCSPKKACDAFFQSCWATTSDNPYNWPRHNLIENGCVVDETVRMDYSGSSNKSRFSVDAFAFLGWRIRDTVFVNCHLFVCNANDNDSICKMGCQPGNFKRASRRDIQMLVSSPGLVRGN